MKLKSKILATLSVILLHGCAGTIMHPQSLLPAGAQKSSAAILLNSYEGDNERYSYFVTMVDDRKVGNAFGGVDAINEIYITEGEHTLQVVLNTAGSSYVGNRSFSGPVRCKLLSGYFYTIDYTQAEASKSYDTNNLGVNCIQHSIKPENHFIKKLIKHGGKVTTDFYPER
jgi:hypothetical protein